MIEQIMDEINDKSNQLCKKVLTSVDDMMNGKFMNILTSYKHSIGQFEFSRTQSTSKKSAKERDCSVETYCARSLYPNLIIVQGVYTRI